MFVQVFEPDARLRVYNPADSPEPTSQHRGHEALAAIPEILRRNYAKTYHLLGNATYDIAGMTATGEVYCVAHHLTAGESAATDRIMFIRYRDQYRRGDDGVWRIVDRAVLVDWTETRAADLR